jgi:hypothetical protein
MKYLLEMIYFWKYWNNFLAFSLFLKNIHTIVQFKSLLSHLWVKQWIKNQLEEELNDDGGVQKEVAEHISTKCESFHNFFYARF